MSLYLSEVDLIFHKYYDCQRKNKLLKKLLKQSVIILNFLKMYRITIIL